MDTELWELEFESEYAELESDKIIQLLENIREFYRHTFLRNKNEKDLLKVHKAINSFETCFVSLKSLVNKYDNYLIQQFNKSYNTEDYLEKYIANFMTILDRDILEMNRVVKDALNRVFKDELDNKINSNYLVTSNIISIREKLNGAMRDLIVTPLIYGFSNYVHFVRKNKSKFTEEGINIKGEIMTHSQIFEYYVLLNMIEPAKIRGAPERQKYSLATSGASFHETNIIKQKGRMTNAVPNKTEITHQPDGEESIDFLQSLTDEDEETEEDEDELD